MQRHPSSLPTSVALLVLALALAGCGAVDGLRDTETATEAEAAIAAVATEPDEAVLAEEPADEDASADVNADAAGGEAPAEESVAIDNPGAWQEIDRAAQGFAARLDEATQGIASCQTEAAAGVDFNACLGDSFDAIATAGDEMAALVAAASERADGSCREALGRMGEATREMAADYRSAIGIRDLTSLETAYLEIADDAGVYAESAMAAAGACAG